MNLKNLDKHSTLWYPWLSLLSSHIHSTTLMVSSSLSCHFFGNPLRGSYWTDLTGHATTSNSPNFKGTIEARNAMSISKQYTLQGTNISPKNGILKMIFLFPRWDMLISWRVLYLHAYIISNYRYPTPRKFSKKFPEIRGPQLAEKNSKPQHFQHVDWILLLQMRQDMPLKSLAKSLQQPQWRLGTLKDWNIQDLHAWTEQ